MSKIKTLTVALALVVPFGMQAYAQDEPTLDAPPKEEAQAASPAQEQAPVQKAKPMRHHEDRWEPASVFVPLGLWIAIVMVVAFSLYFRSRRIREVHGTLRAMVEKGVDIPPDLLAPPARKDGDLRKGVIFLTSGLGWLLFAVFFFPHVEGGPEVQSLWSIGLIPGMIGLGYMLLWYLRRNKED